MRINSSALLGLSVWLIFIGGIIVYGAYNGSLNNSNAHIVIGLLFLVGDVVGLTTTIRYARQSDNQSGAR